VPAPGPLSDPDAALLAAVDALPERARSAMDQLALHVALADIWSVIAAANRYFAAEEPWVKRKSAPERFATILYVTVEALRAIGIVTQPFIPGAAAKLLDLIGVAGDRRMLKDIGARDRIEKGRVLPAPAPIFPRYVEPELQPAAH
jgi:methionyl-tRNA synthetase